MRSFSDRGFWNCLELAETRGDRQKRRSLLTFSVVGGGLRGSATAAAIRELVNSALVSYPGIGREEPRILLFEEREEILPLFDPALGKAAHRRLNITPLVVTPRSAYSASYHW